MKTHPISKALIVVLFVVVVGASYVIWQKRHSGSNINPTNPNEPVACTLEAKLCPDGKTYVGRTGPNCEFAVCPTVSKPTKPTKPLNPATTTAPVGWKKVIDTQSGVTFSYPVSIETTYIQTAEWPPRVRVLAHSYSCNSGGSEAVQGGVTEEVNIDTQNFCITKVSEGAAGSTYTNYQYAFGKGNKTVVLSFSLRFPQCLNYDLPKKIECTNERDVFDPNKIASDISKILEFIQYAL